MTGDAIQRNLRRESMKQRAFSNWVLGVSLTIFLSVAARLQSMAETVPSEATRAVPATLSATETLQVSADASEEDLATADTDAPAKLVSNEKPLPPTIRPTGPVAEVVKLANSGLDDTVMLAFVTNSSSTFNLGAEEIIYLNDIGVPGSVVTAMIQRDQVLKTELAAGASPPPSEAPASLAEPANCSQLAINNASADQAPPQAMEPGSGYPVEAPLTPPEDGSDGMFYDGLSPYGNWVDVDGYGRCWQPTVELVNPGWQPYFDCGHWVYSDCGWYWLSDYSWGWAPFHYGSWFRHGRLGWCWVPGRVWGPSWVSWRYDKDYCGWAPLPPGASFAGGGLTFHGRHVRDRDDLGLRPAHYHFVAWNHFDDRQLRPHRLPAQDAARVYESSTVATRIGGDGRTVINNGLPTSRVAAATHRPIHTVALREASQPIGIGGRAESFEASGHTLTVYRPNSALASRMPAREFGTGLSETPRSSAGPARPVSPAPAGARSGSNRHSFNDSSPGSPPVASQSAPLILRGPQSSALRETAPANSLVVIGGRKTAQPPMPARPWSSAASSTVPAAESRDNSTPAKSSTPGAIGNQYQQRNWMGTVTSSPQPSWFAGTEARSASQFNNASAPRPEARSYQAVPRSEVPRYSPAPSYAPQQRSYSAPAYSAPARQPSFETRSAPSAPSAPAASHSAPAQSSGKNGR